MRVSVETEVRELSEDDDELSMRNFMAFPSLQEAVDYKWNEGHRESWLAKIKETGEYWVVD